MPPEMKLHVRVGDTAYDLEYSCDPDLPVSWLMSQVMRDVDEAHHVIELQVSRQANYDIKIRMETDGYKH